MLDCTKCLWSSPEACRVCKAEQKEQEQKEAKYQEIMVKQSKSAK